ncbi:hypothetical protein PSHI8_02840 [Polynucleobacter sp. SHI8]|uniref:glycosyltransferase n=1 Tax=unclassified Polynucleobacter TaxID=2640945 RepID=UPI00248FDE69|nr:MULTISPECIES: glycosyltransferase [unclassified Polynucleobacter]BDW10202.1 hypothetical protein PSHI2_02840 [Polynucleobacter sp. SHI2]BDW12648.1 hypothetical protein PSHI8_02840 [Polynucleobacter sp. SHI8]
MKNNLPAFFEIVFLGLNPVEHKSEGLIVLLSDNINALQKQGILVRIHTTGRHIKSIKRVLSGNNVDIQKVKFAVYKVEAITLILIHFLMHRGRSKVYDQQSGILKHIKNKLTGAFKIVIPSIFTWSLDLSPFNIWFKVPLNLGVIIILICIVFFVGLIFLLLLLFIKLGLRLINKIQGFKFVNRKSMPKDLLGLLKKIYNAKNRLIQYLQWQVYTKEQIRFAKKINTNKDIKKLFFFTAFDGFVVSHFKGSSLVTLPDFITLVYPLRFIAAHNKDTLEGMRLSIKSAKAVICYSEFVKTEQLHKFFPKEVENQRVEVIPQGYFPTLETSHQKKEEAGKKLNEKRSFIINPFKSLLLAPPVVDFTQFNFLLYPTIDRPHKNTLILVKAFSKLLRECNFNIKLILTTPHPSKDVEQFILEQRLQYDVIFMPSVDLETLDLLCEKSSLVVHPSLAEGGDVFNFSRAASTKTPALLADVQVVREMFEREGLSKCDYDDWVFDPVDMDSLFQKIKKILLNPEEVIEKQYFYSKKLSRYSFDDMARRYLKLYESI